MADVARAAGVGVATVDRVLNARAPVRRATAERVLEAARRVGYHRAPLIAKRVREAPLIRRLGFVLQKRSKFLYRRIADEVEAAARRHTHPVARTEATFVETLSPDDLAEAIARMARRVDAMAVVAIEHPRIALAVREAASRGCPVFALLSPLQVPEIAGYIGIDGRRAGRTAGWAMARLVNFGPIGILVGSHRYAGHEALEMGFRGYMREHAPHLTLRESLVYLDDTAVAYEAASELLARVPQLSGLYHCGGGVRGVIRALEESGRAREIAYVCHGRSPATEAGLARGVVSFALATPVRALAETAVRAMIDHLAGREAAAIAPLTFEILTPENV